MKHKSMIGMAALLALGLCVGLTACGGTKSGDAVDAETWTAAFDGLDNYTAESSGMGNSITRCADGWVNLDTSALLYGANIIVSATSNDYYMYTNMNGKWEKRNDGMGKEMYESSMGYDEIFSVFKENYDQFTFTDGKYLCESINANITIQNTEISCCISNIEVIFDSDGLKEIKCDYAPSDEEDPNRKSSIKVTEIGTTKIEFPTEFDDKATKE